MRLAVLALSLCAALAPLGAGAQPADRHADAVRLARDGRHDAALAALQALASERPDDRRIRFDTIVVLGWAQRDAQALALAADTDLADAPAYVLESIGRSARNEKRFELAEATYRRSLNRNPDRAESRIGLALTLADLGRPVQAAALLEPLLAKAPPRLEALEARAAIAESQRDWMTALSHHQRTLQQAPNSRDAVRGVVRSAAALGAPHIARSIAVRHPGLLPEAELAALSADASALGVRYGRTEERIETGAARFRWLDRTLADSESAAARLAADGGADARGDALSRRLLSDRIVALSLRHRSQAAVDLYHAMRAADLAVPIHATKAAADALLATRKPEEAAVAYGTVLKATPDDFDAALGMFYALVESERLDDAAAWADALAERTPKWLPPRRPNPDAVTARTATAQARLYGDRLGEAETRIRALRDELPYNTGVREAWASTALARGWPRLADEEFRRALAIDPASAGLRAERVGALLAVNAFGQARGQLGEAATLRPEDARVRTAQDVLAVHDMRQLELSSGYGRSSGAAPTGDDDWRLDARLYSQPLAEHWRIFAQTSRSRAEFVDGPIDWHREGVGAEYRVRDLRALAAVTTGSGDRTGVFASAEWEPDDRWRLGLAGSTVSSNIPMQVWKAGIRASEVAAVARYAWHESRNVYGGLATLGFSDGNDRLVANVGWFERWVSTPDFRIESSLGVGTSTNSTSDRPYFNPGQDATATLEVAGEWLGWRRYERSFRQRLAGTVGGYWQQDFGSGRVLGVLYEHLWEIDRRLTVRYGIGRTLRPYDGETSGRTYGSLSLDWRF
jgi:biofilm PGA synthesis protein PgaA